MAILIYDSFTVEANTTLTGHLPDTNQGSAWVQEASTGQVTINNAEDWVRFGSSGHNPRLYVGASNVIVRVDRFTSDAYQNSANSIALHTNRSNSSALTDAYEALFDFTNDVVEIAKIVGSVRTIVAGPTAYAFSNTADYQLYFSTNNGSHEVKINGSSVLTATNSDVPSSQYVGIGSRNISVGGRARTDDFYVETISNPTYQSYATSVVLNENSSWSASNTTILGDISDENTATYAAPANAGDALRVKFGVVDQPVGSDLAQIIISYALPQTLPAIPLNAAAAKVAASETALDLTWDAVAGATGYKVYQVLASDTEIADVATNSWQHTGLTSWVEYHYKVAAYNAAGTGDKSVSFSERPHDLTAPSAPTINSATPVGNVVTFDVTKATDSASGVSEHELYNGVNFFSTFTIPDFDVETGEELPVQVTVPQSFGTVYDWKFRAKDAAGNTGNFSNIVQTTGKTSPAALIRLMR